MIKKKTIKILISLLVLLIVLSGCSSTPKIGSGQKDEVKLDTFTPQSLDGIEDELAEHEKYKKNYASAYSSLNPTAEGEFEYAEVDGGVKITGFVGESEMVIIPKTIGDRTVVEIGESVFYEKQVRSIYIPDSVKKICKGALEGAESLTLLRLPFVGDGGEILHIGHIFGADTYETNALSTPVSLEMIIVGEGCESIADRAFYGMKSIEAIALEGVVSIGEFAFYGCDELKYIYLPEALNSIGNYAFGECEALASVTVPDGVERIGFGAFYCCYAMCDMTLPTVGDGDENTHIGYIFGAEYSEWNENYVPKRLRRITLTEACTRIEGKAFANCNGIVEINLPESLEFIGVRAFVNCRSLASVETGEALLTISGDAFFNCDNMKSLTVKGNTKIENQAFFGCDRLESKSIAQGATVADDAFDK